MPRTGATEAAEREETRTPRIGASGADWSTAPTPGLDRPGVHTVPRTVTSEATGRTPRTGTSGDATHPDWSVRGQGGPGLERPGQQKKKEEETAAERNGEENKNKSKEQMGKDKKEGRREAGGEREEGEAAKHMEPGWEQPGKQCTRSGSTGSGASLQIINGERRRLRKEGATAAARTDKECMNRSLERWRERTRNSRDGKGEEKERQVNGTRTGTSGEAMRPDWNIRGAEALDWNVRGGKSPGLERSGPQKGREMAAESSGEEHMNMSMDQMGKDTTHERREVGGEGAKGKAANHVEPGRGQPGEQRTRAGTSGGEAAMEWSVQGSRRKKRRRRQETTRGKECMHKSQGPWRERTRRAREGKREEKEKQAHGTRTGTSGGRRFWTGTSGEAATRHLNVRGTERRGIR